MSELLADLSDPALIKAIKSNLYALFGVFGRSPGVDVFSHPALSRWRTRIPHPLFQIVLVTAAAPGDEERLIRESRDHFDQHGIAGFCWWFSPEVDPSPWEGPLRRLGFAPDNDPPGMAVALDALAEPASPARLTIARVEDLDTLGIWTRTFAAGYGLPAQMTGDFYQLLVDIGLDSSLQHYIGYLDGVPVAASSLWLAAGVAGIYNVATLPEARGQGIGAALTLAPLRDARAMGYRAGVLQSSEIGFTVYQRLGFRHLCGMDHYFWPRRSN
jgi:ribosomal protein S18 acetylase RimI-like enzyme